MARARRLSSPSSAHLALLQVLRLKVVDLPSEADGWRLCASSSPDELITALASAAEDGTALLVPAAGLERLLGEPGSPQLRLDGLASDDAQPRQIGPGSSAAPKAVAAAGSGQTADALAPTSAPGGLALALAERAMPLSAALQQRVVAPDWCSVEARRAQTMLEPSAEERAVLTAAADGDAAALAELLGIDGADTPARPPTPAEAPTEAPAGASPLTRARLPPSGATPLHLASTAGDLAAVEALLRAGSDVHAAAANGSTALHWAAGSGHVEVVRALLDAGAGCETRSSTWCSTVRGTDSGQTPAHWAAAAGHGRALAELLAQAPDTLILRDERALSPADVAQREGHLPLQSELLGRERAAHVCVRVSKELAAHRAVEFSPTTQPSRDGDGAITD